MSNRVTYRATPTVGRGRVLNGGREALARDGVWVLGPAIGARLAALARGEVPFVPVAGDYGRAYRIELA